MKVIATAGNKGGIGKSTISLTLAQYLCKVKGMKGAFIDLDPQGNSSSSLVKMIRDPSHPTGYMPSSHPEWDPMNLPSDDPHWDGISSISDIFVGRAIYPYPTWVENLDCFPSFASILEDAQRVLRSDVIEKVVNRMNDFVKLLSEHSDYEFVIIDTNPQFGPLTMSGLRSATHVLLPTELEQYGINGTVGMMEAVSHEQRRRSPDNPLKIAGVIPNKVKRNSVHSKFLENLKQIKGADEWLLPSVSARIAYSKLVVDNANPNCVFDLKNSDPAKLESENWCGRVFNRIFNDRNYAIKEEAEAFDDKQV